MRMKKTGSSKFTVEKKRMEENEKWKVQMSNEARKVVSRETKKENERKELWNSLKQ